MNRPIDWNETIVGKGFSKNLRAMKYDVRLSVGGKQYYIAGVDSQAEARRVYDLALWKLGGKMMRSKTPNDAEAFSFITQEQVDRECPRLNTLWGEIPYVNGEDWRLSEEALRARNKSPVPVRGLKEYNEAIMALKRQRIELLEVKRKSENRELTLPYVHKLAEVQQLFSRFRVDILAAVATLDRLTDSMEAQREYYQRMSRDESNLV